jgi:hypothetical protein
MTGLLGLAIANLCVFLVLSGTLTKAIANSANGLNQVAVTQFAAQRFDVHINGSLQYYGTFADGGIH